MAGKFIGNDSKLKKPFIESLIKTVIQSKVRIRPDYLQSLELKFITHDEFSADILPAVKKAILRSPEIAFASIARILKALNLDLSRYEEELNKPICVNLIAKDDQTREDAVETLQSLADQCSDAESLERLLKALFKVLNGSEGKLTVNSHKASVLKAVGKIREKKLISLTFESTLKWMENEVHEGTLLETLDALSNWSKLVTAEVPQSLVDHLPKGMTSKSSTSAVKIAYLGLLLDCLQKCQLDESGAKKLTPILTKTLDSCLKQPSQMSLCNEAALSCACLVKMEQSEFWKNLEEKKNLFNNEKFLLSAPLKALAILAEKVLLEKNSTDKAWFRALNAALMSPDLKTRKSAQMSMKRILTEAKFGLILLDEMNLYLENVTFVDCAKEISDNSHVLTKFVGETLMQIACLSPKEDQVCLKMLNPCHFDAVTKTDSRLWAKLASKMEIDASKLVAENSEQILNDLLEGKLNKCCIDSVLNVNSKIIPAMMRILDCKLSDNNLQSVTAEQFAISKSKKGELFDNSFMDKLLNDNTEVNIKRESKAYSYKEQMEELALRKELEEKRRKEGKIVAPKLTPKQKEALNAQIEKEDKIRDEVSQMKTRVDPILTVFRAALEGNPRHFGEYSHQLTEILLKKGLKSPVSASESVDIFARLSRSVFYEDDSDKLLGARIAWTVIQINSASCDLSLRGSMNKEEVKKAAHKIVKEIHVVCFDDNSPLSTPAFGFFFPVLEHAVKNHLNDDDFVIECCKLMSEHAESRGITDDEEEFDEFHPKYLPIKNMLRLLMDIIEKTHGRSQQNAVSTVVDVCKAANGGSGCAKAGEKEIRVLLAALQVQVEPVRDAGLRGLRALQRAFPFKGRTVHFFTFGISFFWVKLNLPFELIFYGLL